MIVLARRLVWHSLLLQLPKEVPVGSGESTVACRDGGSLSSTANNQPETIQVGTQLQTRLKISVRVLHMQINQ
jgi:hypothetical protein